jgi:hypothetical protein
MSVKLRLTEADRDERHPFRSLHWSARPGEGHRLKIVLSLPAAEPGQKPAVLWRGEATLAWWADDCANGMHVTVKLDDGPDGAADGNLFKGMATGAKGETLRFACWAVADDETLQPPPAQQRPQRQKVPFGQMDATRQAAIKCADDAFRMWCAGEACGLIGKEAAAELPAFAVDPAAFAAGVVRAYCGVASRSELRQPGPGGDAARARWAEMLARHRVFRPAR